MSSNGAFGRIMKTSGAEPKEKKRKIVREKGPEKVRVGKAASPERRQRKKRQPVTVFVNATKARKYAGLVEFGGGDTLTIWKSVMDCFFAARATRTSSFRRRTTFVSILKERERKEKLRS
jgi:hypothetical protein